MRLAPFAEAVALIYAADPDATVWPGLDDDRNVVIYLASSAPSGLRLSSSLRRKLRSLGMAQNDNKTWNFPYNFKARSEP